MSQTKGPTTVTEDGSNRMVFTETVLGYKPDGVYSHHEVEVTNLGARTWSVELLGPAGDWRAYASGKDATDTVVIADRFPKALRVVMSGAGSAAVAHVQSTMKGL